MDFDFIPSLAYNGKQFEAPRASEIHLICPNFSIAKVEQHLWNHEIFIIEVTWKDAVIRKNVGILSSCRILVGRWIPYEDPTSMLRHYFNWKPSFLLSSPSSPQTKQQPNPKPQLLQQQQQQQTFSSSSSPRVISMFHHRHRLGNSNIKLNMEDTTTVNKEEKVSKRKRHRDPLPLPGKVKQKRTKSAGSKVPIRSNRVFHILDRVKNLKEERKTETVEACEPERKVEPQKKVVEPSPPLSSRSYFFRSLTQTHLKVPVIRSDPNLLSVVTTDPKSGRLKIEPSESDAMNSWLAGDSGTLRSIDDSEINYSPTPSPIPLDF